jgi:hypothetical protein
MGIFHSIDLWDDANYGFKAENGVKILLFNRTQKRLILHTSHSIGRRNGLSDRQTKKKTEPPPPVVGVLVSRVQWSTRWLQLQPSGHGTITVQYLPYCT